MNWHQLAATSHYQTAVAVANELAQGKVDEAETGLQELIDAVARAERRALRSQLIRLMAHVLKWKMQPVKRTSSWAVTIHQAREEIAGIQEEVPTLTPEVIEGIWEKCFDAAKRQAEEEMQQEVAIESLSWEEVFEEEYTLFRPSRARKQPKRKGGRR